MLIIIIMLNTFSAIYYYFLYNSSVQGRQHWGIHLAALLVDPLVLHIFPVAVTQSCVI